MRNVLNIEGVTKVYPGGRVALNGLNLSLEPGVFGLLGPNGAGKTTLLEILGLEREPECGSVQCDGIDAWKHPVDWRRLLGIVPQHFGFVSHLTGRETLFLMGSLSGLSTRSIRSRVDSLLERVRLSWASGRRVEAYSRGMRQRLGIAVSLLNNPGLWLLDEPTSGLDPEERVAFRELLAEEGPRRVTILSTHIVEDVERCCSRVGVLSSGKIVFDGSPTALTNRAEKRVWEWEIEPESVDRWATDSRVVAVRAVGETVRVRAVTSTPPTPEARSEAPTLEDAYLSLLGEGLYGAE